MISLSRSGDNLVLTSTESTLVGTEVYVNDDLKFTVSPDGLLSDVLGAGVDESDNKAYVVFKYNNRVVLINRNALNVNYGQYFSAGVDEGKVLWYTENHSTGVISPWTYEDSSTGEDVQHTGYYVASPDASELFPAIYGGYARLILKEDGYFYLNCYVII